MRSPFPGMDPYLEHPSLWPGVHNSLIAAIRDDLASRLAPRYYVGLERRAYLLKPDDIVFIGRPDIAFIPLLPGDEEPRLNLGQVLHDLYQRARFDLRLNYQKPAVPPINDSDADWALEQLSKA